MRSDAFLSPDILRVVAAIRSLINIQKDTHNDIVGWQRESTSLLIHADLVDWRVLIRPRR